MMQACGIFVFVPRPLRRCCAAVCVIALLAGCGSTPPTAWYLLSAQPSPPATGERPTVGIVSLELAEYLLTPQILSMESANRVRRAEFARWAEPLDEGVARVLALNLAAELGSQGVRLGPWPREWVPGHELRLRIEQLDARESGVELVAAWSLRERASGASRDRITRLSRARSGSDASAIAADFSALIAELAGVIAGEITVRAASSDR